MLDNILIYHPASCRDSDTEIIISDINQPMLDVGKSKAERIKIEGGIFLQILLLAIYGLLYFISYILHLCMYGTPTSRLKTPDCPILGQSSF